MSLDCPLAFRESRRHKGWFEILKTLHNDHNFYPMDSAYILQYRGLLNNSVVRVANLPQSKTHAQLSNLPKLKGIAGGLVPGPLWIPKSMDA